MNKVAISLLLLMVSGSVAMESESAYSELSSGPIARRRGRKETSESEAGTKQAKIRAGSSKSAQLFAVSPTDTTKVLLGVGRNNVILMYMRALVKLRGFERDNQQELIATIAQGQDRIVLKAALEQGGGFLKQHCIQCPACKKVLQTDSSKFTAYKLFFNHWFTTLTHQPRLYTEASKLIATTQEQALSKYQEHGLPVSAVVPLPVPKKVHVVPVDDPMEVEDPMEIEESISKTWFIVEPYKELPGALTTFCAPTRQDVVEQFLVAKLSALSLESRELQEQVEALKQNEEVEKQLMVQTEVSIKQLVCPEERCEVLVCAQEDHDKNKVKVLNQLFARMALHQIVSHQDDNQLCREAQQRAAPSFDQARANLLALNENAP